MGDDGAVEDGGTLLNPDGGHEPGDADPRRRPGAWLRALGESLDHASETSQADVVYSALRNALARVVDAATSRLDFDQRPFSDEEERRAARSLLRALLDVLPEAEASIPSPELDIQLAATGDGWLTAVWVVMHASETVRFGSDEWMMVAQLAPELERRSDEAFAQWCERRDELADRIQSERRSKVGNRHIAMRDLDLLVLRLFGSPLAAERWMRTPHRLLEGSTPEEAARQGVDGIRRVTTLLLAIEGSVYQ